MEEKGPTFFVNEYIAPAGRVSVCEIHGPSGADAPPAARAGYDEERGHGEFRSVAEARARCHELGYTLRAVDRAHAIERWMRPPRP